MENHGLSDIIGSASYMTTLANTYGLAVHYSAVSHPSEPNYCALIGAEYNYCSSDGICCGQDPGLDIVDSLEAKGLSWKAYAEDASSSGTCNFSPPRSGDHFPFLDFQDIQTNSARCANFQTTSSSSDPEFLSALSSPSSAPNFLWLTPNDCNNMHDCSVSTGDSYLAGLVPKILSSPTFTTKRAALFIVFDEGNGSYPSDYVYAVWAGPTVKLGHSSSNQYSHYAFLRTLEENWNLPTLTSNDAAASPMSEFFGTSPPQPAPLATSFTTTTNTPQVGTTVTFTATTTGGTSPYSITWSFGDGTTGTGPVVTHSFATAQSFDVAETAKDSSSPQLTANSSQTLTVSSVVTGNFGRCASLPLGWSCGNATPSTSSATIVNGVLETRESNPGLGNDSSYYYATSQKGTFPWGPCQAPASGVIPSGVTSVSANFTQIAYNPDSNPSSDRYHLYIALYYWLPNGAVSAGGFTYRCLDTQARVENVGGTFSPVGSTATYNPGYSFGWDQVTLSNIIAGRRYTLTANVVQQCQGDLAAWGLPTNTSCQLAGIEIGTEGFRFQELDVNWGYVSLATTSPSSLKTTASFTPSLPATAQNISFTSTTTGGSSPYSYSWSFGDGSTTTIQNPTHSYSFPGTYDVTLSASDSSNPQQTSMSSVVVNVVPSSLVASFSYTPTSPLSRQPVAFTAAAAGGTPPYSYTWTFGDGTSGAGASIIHTYSSQGNRTVTLTVHDNIGGTATQSSIVTVTQSALPGDVDGDCIVNLNDLAIVANAYGMSQGQPGFDPRADIDHNGVINILDVAIVAAEFGQRC